MTAQAKLRRISLARQGLANRSAFGSGLAGTRRAIERLGYVQIDTISVVTRAHHHVLLSRVPGYRPEMLERLQAQGRIFEYWAHAAAYLPMSDYRFALPHMQAMRARQARWVRSHDDELMGRVLNRVRAEGPLMARDFAAPEDRRAGPWWDWKPAKRALEQLFMQGDLMTVGRSGFQKVYDLTERVLPADVDTRPPTLAEYAAHLVQRHVTAHGFASVPACAHLRQTPGLREALGQALADARERGELVETTLDAGAGTTERVHVAVDALEQRAPSLRGPPRLLSPFDNLLTRRQRGQSLFGFDYQIECYVPEPKRRFGYFCLPVLYGERLVGRADCKAHRRDGRLEIRRTFVEHPEWLPRDRDEACRGLARALWDFAGHNDCDRVTLGDVDPVDWRAPLTKACRQLKGEIS